MAGAGEATRGPLPWLCPGDRQNALGS
jgi:hypothetical protein